MCKVLSLTAPVGQLLLPFAFVNARLHVLLKGGFLSTAFDLCCCRHDDILEKKHLLELLEVN